MTKNEVVDLALIAVNSLPEGRRQTLEMLYDIAHNIGAREATEKINKRLAGIVDIGSPLE